MEQPQLYKIIGIPIVIGLILTGIVMFLGSSATIYDIAGDDDNTQIIINQLKESTKDFNDVKDGINNETSTIGNEQAEADKEGNLISQGWTAVKTVGNSYELFTGLVSQSLENMHLGQFSNAILIAIISLITLVFVGISLLVIFRVRV